MELRLDDKKKGETVVLRSGWLREMAGSYDDDDDDESIRRRDTLKLALCTVYFPAYPSFAPE